MNKIYGLWNPIEKNYFYVGITSTMLDKRLCGHMSSTDKNPKKVKIIKALSDKGIRPEIHLIEEVPLDDTFLAAQRELFWIKEYINSGHPLVNKSLNGSGRKPSENPKIPITIYVEKGVVDGFGGANEFRNMVYQQIEQWKAKAEKWDALEEKIASHYVDENGDELPEDEGGDLLTIGELAASAFGWL